MFPRVSTIPTSSMIPPWHSNAVRHQKQGPNLRWPEELLQQDVHAPCHLGHEEVLSQLVEGTLVLLVPLLGRLLAKALWRRAQGRRVAPSCHQLCCYCRRGEAGCGGGRGGREDGGCGGRSGETPGCCRRRQHRGLRLGSRCACVRMAMEDR